MKKFILIAIAFSLFSVQLNAQLQAQQAQIQTQIKTDSVETDSIVLYQDNLMELGKANFISKDSIANFTGKRFEKAAINSTKKEFDTLVESSTQLFKTKSFEQITDIEHRTIIRLINTIAAQELSGNHYEELEEMVVSKDYAVKMTTTYTWIYSKGLGFHFLELGFDLGGKENENLFLIKN